MQNAQPVSKPALAVFRCGERRVAAGEIIAAAHFRGELEPMWQRLLRSIATEEKAAEMELELDETAFQTMSENFRYERDLITGDETERWLEERGLTLADFSVHFARRYWTETLKEELEPERIEYLSAQPELRDLLTADLFLSGEFDRLATELSWRVAARQASAGEEPDPELVATERERFLKREGIDEAALRTWLRDFGCDPQWLNETLKLEAIYHQRCRALLTDEAAKRELENHRIDFMRANVETIELESNDAAREALLCAREDGEPLDELAHAGGYPYRRVRIMIAELPDELQRRCLCAAPGEVLDPVSRGDGFHLWRIVEKIEPSLDDGEIRRRVEQRILHQHFSELAAKEIHWVIAPNPGL